MEIEEQVESQAAVIDRIFEFWKVRHGHARARLDQKRRSKIRQRLCDRYTERDLLDAIEGCALSSWHMGSDPRNTNATVYNDIELICRDAKHVDMFIKRFEEVKAKKGREIAHKKFEQQEEDRRRREADERRGQTRHSGLKAVS